MAHPYPRPTPYALKVRRSSAGFGLYAGEPIPKGRFVIEYWGKVVDDATAVRTGGRYLFEAQPNRNILGADRRNVARYINHGCRPNCEAREVGGRVFIFSIRPIKTGDELSYNYGRDYFNIIIKPHGCRCASCQRQPTKKTR
jgi:SET domain-containing protein